MASNELIFDFMKPVYARLVPFSHTALRITTGALLMPHGAQKLFGWFGGYGLEATGQFFEQSLGYSNGYLAAMAAGSVEFFGGLLLITGLFTRVGAAAVVFLLFMALPVHLANGFFWTDGGIEYLLMWMVLAMICWVRGGGEFSLDRLIGREF